MEKVIFKIMEKEIEVINHFEDKVKCNTISALLYFAQNVLNKQNNLKEGIQEWGYTKIIVINKDLVFDVLKDSLREYKKVWSNEINLFDSEKH